MMLFWKVILWLWGAYMVGSIPTSVWVGRLFHGVDVRDHGSGNAGATNTIRVLGLKTGIPVLVFDAFKGWIVVILAPLSGFFVPGSDAYVNFQLSMGISAVLGHLFPVYAGFRGGKGVATLFGVIIALFPGAFGLVLLLFAIIFAITRIVSLSSIIAAITFPVVVIFLFHVETPSLILFSMVIAVFIPVTHQKNIVRLFRGEESRMVLKKPEKPTG
ncbi:MAG TPA: glycerol-3-phosphate 1-O-acyltransferase PlsY [Bacteroidales bacterium]|nr:glycerol-3-phosphate 1-O-acyltransferase PlsY [Bacteroidales bacterium]